MLSWCVPAEPAAARQAARMCMCVWHGLVCMCRVGAYLLSPLVLGAWGVCVRGVGCACARLVSREGGQGRASQGQGQGALMDGARLGSTKVRKAFLPFLLLCLQALFSLYYPARAVSLAEESDVFLLRASLGDWGFGGGVGGGWG